MVSSVLVAAAAEAAAAEAAAAACKKKLNIKNQKLIVLGPLITFIRTVVWFHLSSMLHFFQMIIHHQVPSFYETTMPL
jgi:hypothetical protein